MRKLIGVMCFLALSMSLPAYGLEIDTPDAPPTTQQTPITQQPAPSSDEDTKFQLDTTDRNHDPLIKTDKGKSKPVEDLLSGSKPDVNKVAKGFSAASPLISVISTIIGWLVALLVASLSLFNLLGLIYVAVPLGFLRNILSGGAEASPAQGNMGSPYMGGMGRMGMGRMGGMGASPAAAQTGSTLLSKLKMVPDSAIQAVAMASSGERGGAAMQSPGMMGGRMGMGGMGMGAQQAGGSAAPVRPIPYYLKAQAWDMFFLGIGIIILVFSSVLFDTGLKVGSGLAQLLEWLISFVV